MSPPLPAVESTARAVLAEVLGTAAAATAITVLQQTGRSAVLAVERQPPEPTLVLKLVRAEERPATDLSRTAAVMERAAAAGVPVPVLLAVDGTGRADGWQYLLHERVPGTLWRSVRPLLGPAEQALAHAEIAAVALALRSVRLDGYGELDRLLGTTGDDLLAALRCRARLRTPPCVRLRMAEALLERAGPMLAGSPGGTLCHDDLHHHNLVFDRSERGWRLRAVLDWDKAWAGPAEADLARLAFWDDMTGPGFWSLYRAAVPLTEGEDERLRLHQLLWCLEHETDTARHRADTAALCRRFGLEPPLSG